MRVGLGHSRQTEALPTLAGMSALPPKANFPILELLPSPTLSEHRHRGLARRLVAVRRRAVLRWQTGRARARVGRSAVPRTDKSHLAERASRGLISFRFRS